MGISSRGILSPLRLPISPPGLSSLTAWRSNCFLFISPARETRTDGDQRGELHCSPLDSPSPFDSGKKPEREIWRLGSESNRRTRLCRPLHDHSATQPWYNIKSTKNGAGNEIRTRDPNLGKVVLYH